MVRADDGLRDGGVERVERREKIELDDVERAEAGRSCTAMEIGLRGLREIQETNRGLERLLASENQRFRDVCMGKDGKLYAITDDGRMYSLGKE